MLDYQVFLLCIGMEAAMSESKPEGFGVVSVHQEFGAKIRS